MDYRKCEIWGSHSGTSEGVGFLGCDALCIVKYLP